MSGNPITVKPNSENYDIDGFIKQLLASQKFDELAEKVADKAVNRIKNIDPPTARFKGLSDANEINITTENILQEYQGQSNRKHVEELDKSLSDNIHFRNGEILEKHRKIDTQAVMMDETTSQSENLRLKYKYLTRNVYNEKVPENDTKEDQLKQNETTGPADKFKDHDTKTEEHTSNLNAPEKNQYNPKEELMHESDNRPHDIRDDEHKELDFTGNSKAHENPHSSMDGEKNENSNKNDHPREDMSPGHEHTNSHEAQNSKPELKTLVKNEKEEASHPDNRATEKEENPSKLNEENKGNVPPSEEKTAEEKTAEEKTAEEKTAEEKTADEKTAEENTVEEVEKTEEEPEKSGTEENFEENRESDAPHMRADEEDYPNVDENKVTSDNNPFKSGYRTSGSEGNGDRIEEHREQLFSENQEMVEQEEDPESISHKPVIRREGDKMFTFVEDSGYEEYHEQLAKMQKEHPQNPLDFI